ncbi:MAG: TonB-dependent receptor plug domain-containing protein [Vicinamibacteria bacterium]
MRGWALPFIALLAGPAAAEDASDAERPPERQETIVVTATRTEQPVGDVVSFVTLVPGSVFWDDPGLTLDDALRQIPGFSLLRRSGAIVANPTSQGVSLRGIGTSGASRTLVLLDGVPLNDPFGGWIQWNRIPLLAIDGVEVVRGAGSALYGNASMGGTIEVRTRQKTGDTLSLRAQGGTRGTYDVDGIVAHRSETAAGLVAGRVFGTDGFFVVDEADRGPVDTEARSLFKSLLASGSRNGFHGEANVFDERRGNGTPLQKNHTTLGLVAAGYGSGAWSFDGFSQWGRFDNQPTRILPHRVGEVPLAEDDTSSEALGAAISWRPRRGFLAGTDWRHVSAEGETQDLAGVFAQQLFSVNSRTDLLLGLRLDAWKSQESHTAADPRLGLLFRASRSVTIRASGYRGFRTPTLNELYRPFRVGNVQTNANPDLTSESLWGGEMGADFHPWSALLVRTNLFWNALDDPIGNVTLSVTPQETLRQRQNLPGARTRGVEAEASILGGRAWQATVSYLFADARVDSGLAIPQVPRHQGSFGVTWRGPLVVVAQGRFATRQFEDDLNTLPLGAYAVCDLAVSRRVARSFEVFVAADNLFDRAYAVGRTPVPTFGTPRMIHGGIGWGRSARP